MKARLVSCFLLIAFFLPSIPTQAEGPSVGSVTIRPCRILAGAHRDLNSYGAAGGESRLIIDNWNPAGCGFTDSAVMSLSRPTYVESVQLWYNWAAGESSLPYTLTAGGRVLRQGQFRRGSCDPYQTTWCEATDMLGMNLAPGSYTFATTRRRVCQNSGSNGMGFIHVRGRFVRPEEVSGSPEGTPEVRLQPTPGGGRGEGKLIINNWNTAGCGFTDNAVMNLSRPTHVESVQLWYNWAAGESSLPYTLSGGGRVLRNGQFRRGSCDPYQTAWCEAVDAIDMKLAPGSYTFTTARRRVCQNSGSNGMGFIRVTARARLAGPGAYPGQETIQPSQPATPEITAGPTTDLALGKPAQQSSTYSGDFPASNGVDGRKDDGSMFHTNNERSPWWQVDLQGNYALSYIMLYNRTGCCAERERTVQVLLSQNGRNWQTIYSHNGTDFRELRVEAGGRQARYVRVQLAEQNYFHLQEVEVYGAR
ncbi:MAG: discoidin domain-containing protein [Terriglobia bacterium]|jgi:hypothetical protein